MREIFPKKLYQTNLTKLSYWSKLFENMCIIIYPFPTIRITKLYFSPNHSNFSPFIRGNFYLYLPYLHRMLHELIPHLVFRVHDFALTLYLVCKYLVLTKCSCVCKCTLWTDRHKCGYTCGFVHGGHRIVLGVSSLLLSICSLTIVYLFEARSLTSLERILYVSLTGH